MREGSDWAEQLEMAAYVNNWDKQSQIKVHVPFLW